LSTGTSERVQVDDIMSVRETAGHLIDGFGSRARAYVQVQNGCDHRCTFCIIPFGRGPSRSVPAGEVVAQVRRLVDGGCREVVLTGVDITSYGSDLPGAASLGALVRQILKHVPELQRLRLSSIDQVEADADLMRAIAEEERLMPHLHLSMQAGDDLILKRMKRRHSRADAVRFCDEVRRLRPDVVFGADLIAGFPTETEDMFSNSLSVIDDCGLTYLHVFPYSAREGTPAARMPQVERSVAKERAARLRQKGTDALSQFLSAQAGLEVEVLMERGGVGRTRQFAEVCVDATSQPGALVHARVAGHDGRRLSGEVVA
jgi:threonylcarbamoyladenosine tRNA methylthiotransferase MtaB